MDKLDKPYKVLEEIPNDQYSCTECRFIPEIKNINYESGEIVINCTIHGEKKMNIKDYFDKEIKNVYYNAVCKTSKLEQKIKVTKEKIFSYCFECKDVFCRDCISKHNHKELKLNEINDKCPKHSENNNKYCIQCKNHLCEKCECEHKNSIETIKIVDEEDNKKLIEQKKKIVRNIENQKYFLKLLDTLIETNQKHPYNYFNSINTQTAIKGTLEKDELIEKVKGLEKKILNYLNIKLNVKLDGKEKIIDLNNKGIGTIELELLTGVNFENLEELYLKNNKIDDIGSFKNFYCPKLKKLDLTFNNIHDISPIKNDI